MNQHTTWDKPIFIQTNSTFLTNFFQSRKFLLIIYIENKLEFQIKHIFKSFSSKEKFKNFAKRFALLSFLHPDSEL